MNPPILLERISARLARFRCACGKEFTAGFHDVRYGKTKSCGCLKSKRTAERNKTNAIDGLSHTPTGASWRAAINRCYNPNVLCYARYGAIGIRMCEYIRASILNLIEVIGCRPTGNTIDRIDNSGNYSCGKCAECLEKGWSLNIRWATPKQQGRNQNTNHLVTIGSETKCIAEWAEQIGIAPDSFRNRVNRGWSESDLLSPIYPHGVRRKGVKHG